MNIPSNIVTDLSSTTVSVMNANMPLMIILFGLGIAFYISIRLIKIFPKS